MKQLAYVLILLLITAQFDDYWAVAPVSSFTMLTDDDDEYLPAQRRPQGEDRTSHQKPAFAAVKSEIAEILLTRRDATSDGNSTTPFSAPPLYVFMSLQI